MGNDSPDGYLRSKAHGKIPHNIEEDWGKSYDDYKCLEKKYENIEFAYDGMKIEI